VQALSLEGGEVGGKDDVVANLFQELVQLFGGSFREVDGRNTCV
jgi:hypothetical protein